MFDPAVGESMMRWTIRLSVVLYLWRIWLLIGNQRAKPTANPLLAECWLWTAACAAYLLHVLLAFHFVHEWSHQKAWLHTAAETQRLTGVHRGEGLWVNYLFTTMWCADVIRLWIVRLRKKSSGYKSSLTWHLFVAFIVFNATVVFGPPIYRWLLIPVGLAITLRVIGRPDTTVDKPGKVT